MDGMNGTSQSYRCVRSSRYPPTIRLPDYGSYHDHADVKRFGDHLLPSDLCWEARIAHAIPENFRPNETWVHIQGHTSFDMGKSLGLPLGLLLAHLRLQPSRKDLESSYPWPLLQP